MADNKTKANSTSVGAFLDRCDDARREDAKALTRLMQQVTGCEPVLWGPAIVGFDRLHYKYESGREGDIMMVGFAPRKAANVLYGVTGFAAADDLLATLGKHTVGKGCLYIKSLAAVDLSVLETMIRKAVEAKRAQKESLPDKS